MKDPTDSPAAHSTASSSLLGEQCGACHHPLPVLPQPSSRRSLLYCPWCGSLLSQSGPTEEKHSTASSSLGEQPFQFAIGPYTVIKQIGRGGMGEVFIAYDPSCGRKVALKRVRPDYAKHRAICQRFLKEARITCHLSHPSIVPIYAIHEELSTLYYTMPYVEGITLKKLIAEERTLINKRPPKNSLKASIPAMMRIFLAVCEAVAYAHHRGVLHRDLKPENIIIGHYGEVMILDWGLAQLIHEPKNQLPLPELHGSESLTRVGKIVGTVSHMSPERAAGHSANEATETYALGVILYQLLTLHLPFHRKSIKQAKESPQPPIDPVQRAPYREIPPLLAKIAMKALSPQPEDRYLTVHAMIEALKSYTEGRSEWNLSKELLPSRAKDWQLSEHLFIVEQMAISRQAELCAWVHTMISEESFTGNTKIETIVTLPPKSHGIGIMFAVPEAAERIRHNEGYCLWLSGVSGHPTQLLQSTVEVAQLPEVVLHHGIPYHIAITKVGDVVQFFLDGALLLSYTSHRPIVGTHVGILSRDGHTPLTSLKVFLSSYDLLVSCLAVPDAFLAHKIYPLALNEYRRIAHAFPGRAEGLTARLRAGITLIECFHCASDPSTKQRYWEEALEEFSQLHGTSQAPLEYVGKAIAYAAMGDDLEEEKCFALALRRYEHHSASHHLSEHLILRIQEISHKNRKATYALSLLAVRHLPYGDLRLTRLFAHLTNQWEELPFLRIPPRWDLHQHHRMSFAIALAFWTKKIPLLVEIGGVLLDPSSRESDSYQLLYSDLCYALLHLQRYEELEELGHQQMPESDLLQKIILNQWRFPQHCEEITHALLQCSDRSDIDVRFPLLLGGWLVDSGRSDLFDLLWDQWIAVQSSSLSSGQLEQFFAQKIALLLRGKRYSDAETLLEQVSKENEQHQDSDHSVICFLKGCCLAATEGTTAAKIYFQSYLPASYPRIGALAAHFFAGKQEGEEELLEESEPMLPSTKKLFPWERYHLLKQRALYCFAVGEEVEGNALLVQAYQELFHEE